MAHLSLEVVLSHVVQQLLSNTSLKRSVFQRPRISRHTSRLQCRLKEALVVGDGATGRLSRPVDAAAAVVLCGCSASSWGLRDRIVRPFGLLKRRALDRRQPEISQVGTRGRALEERLAWPGHGEGLSRSRHGPDVAACVIGVVGVGSLHGGAGCWDRSVAVYASECLHFVSAHLCRDATITTAGQSFRAVPLLVCERSTSPCPGTWLVWRVLYPLATMNRSAMQQCNEYHGSQAILVVMLP